MSLGLYLHIPFCSAICGYCNFNRGLLDEALKARYVEALEWEIRRAGAAAGEAGTEADTIYFGGGTPSLLTADEVHRLIHACRESFIVAPSAEITLEANPETLTEAGVAALLEAGVNRFSIGVQSFRDEELRRLGRIHSSARAIEAFALARRVGCQNISLDLMMWLPEQTVDQWRESVDVLIDLQPEHASLYLLEVYPNSPLREDMVRANWSVAPDDDAAEMYLDSMERLEGAGYEQYEISNVARPGARSQHNLKYWTDQEWLGFGCGAHSTRDGVRWHNVADTPGYIDRIAAGSDPIGGRRELTRDQRVEEALFMGLRLSQGVDLEQIGGRYGVCIWHRYGAALAPYAEAGLIEAGPARVRLTRRGMLLANEVMAIFVGPPVR